LVIDIDSFIGEVCSERKQGASYGYTRKLGYHPILAVRSDTGEVLHIRNRQGKANTQRGFRRFVEELLPLGERRGHQQSRVADQPLLIKRDAYRIKVSGAGRYVRCVVHHIGDLLTGPQSPSRLLLKPCSGGHLNLRVGRNRARHAVSPGLACAESAREHRDESS
jgi:hypothetical protein